MILWTILFFHLFGVLNCAGGKECKRFDNLDVLRAFNFDKQALPWTTEEAAGQGWAKVSTVDEYALDMYSYNNVNSLFLFFYNGKLAGVGPTFNYETRSREEKPDIEQEIEKQVAKAGCVSSCLTWVSKKKAQYEGRYMYYHTLEIGEHSYDYAIVLFLDSKILKSKQEDPCTKNTIFFEGKKKGEWHRVPMSLKEMKNEPLLIEQGCYDRFGHFYAYNLKETTECKDLHGFFTFYDEKGNIAGFGAFAYNTSEDIYITNDHPFPVYIVYPIDQIKKSFPNNNKCLGKYNYEGIIAIHFYLKTDSEPATFKCATKPTNYG